MHTYMHLSLSLSLYIYIYISFDEAMRASAAFRAPQRVGSLPSHRRRPIVKCYMICYIIRQANLPLPSKSRPSTGMFGDRYDQNVTEILKNTHTHTSSTEVTIASLPPMKGLYPGVHSTCHGPSWAISDSRL